MTIGEVVQSRLQTWGITIPQAELEVRLAKLNINYCDSLTIEVDLDRFYYDNIPELLVMPKSVSEGGYSISFDRDAIQEYYKFLAKKLNLPDKLESKNGIKDITNQW